MCEACSKLVIKTPEILQCCLRKHENCPDESSTKKTSKDVWQPEKKPSN